ncbi:MAG: hypothetical protein NWE92_09980 [Candidatus Bathyarchaeota archaeon]|nr:hypothetical protein [Candidatus Bathyarchaeota archaeon]
MAQRVDEIVLRLIGVDLMDEVLEMLDRTAKRIQKTVDDAKDANVKHSVIFDQLLSSTDASQEQKMRAFVRKTVELERLEWLNSQLTLLYSLQIFAFKVKVLEVGVEKINQQLVQSGVLQKSGEVEDIKKNIDALKILIEAHYESMKEINETQNQNLAYIK